MEKEKEVTEQSSVEVRGRQWRIEVIGGVVFAIDWLGFPVHNAPSLLEAGVLIAILEGNVQYWKKRHDELATFLSDTAEPLDGCTN